MTVTMFGYLTLINIVLVSIEKIYQTLRNLLDQISKHLEVRRKCSTARRPIFNSLLGVWKCGQTQCFVLDIYFIKRFLPEQFFPVKPGKQLHWKRSGVSSQIRFAGQGFFLHASISEEQKWDRHYVLLSLINKPTRWFRFLLNVIHFIQKSYTLFPNGCHFSVLLFACKLALVASSRSRENILLNFEFKNEATRANLKVNKRPLK